MLSVPAASRRRFGAAADHVEKHLFQRSPSIGRDQSGRRLVLDDAALMKQNDAVGQPLDLGHVVRREQQRRPAGLGIVLELAPHPVGGVRIERGRGLVEQEQIGRVEQGLGKPHARLLAGRQLAGRAVEQRLDLQVLGDKGDAVGGIGDAVQPGIDGQVLPHRQPRRQIDIRALEVHAIGDRAPVAADIGAEHPHLARAWHHEAEQHGDGRGLAGAVAAKQSDRGALGEGETDVVDRGDRAVNLGEVAHRGRRGRIRAHHAGAPLPAQIANSVVHGCALRARFVGIMTVPPPW